MAVRTSSQTGNWADSSTWGGAAAPVDGDSAVVGTSTHVVTIPQGSPVTVGASGADGVIAITLVGSLVINDALIVKGDISQQRTASVTVSRVGANTGGITFAPPAAGTYKWIVPNTGTGTPVITITGEAGDRVPLTTNLATGNPFYFDFTNGTMPPTLNWDYVALTNCGGVGDATATRALSYTGVSASSVTMKHMRTSSNVGKFYFNFIGLNNFTFDWQNNDVRSPRTDWIEIRNNTAAVSGTRQLKECTFYATTAKYLIQWVVGFTIDGGVYANSPIQFDVQDKSNLVKNVIVMNDVSINGLITSRNGTGFIVEESLFLPNVDNPHYIAIGADSGAGLGATIVRLNIADGGTFAYTDDGDFVLGSGGATLPPTITRNLLINKAGTLFTAGFAGSAFICTRNTLNDAGKGATAGETTGAAGQIVRFSSNLITNMPGGLVQDSAFIQQTGLNLDYNGCYNNATAGNFDIGANNGYLGAATYAAWRSGIYKTTDDYGLHDIYGDPGYVDATRTVVSYYNSIKGSGGSWANVLAEVIKLNGTALDGTDATFDSNFTIANIKAYLRAGYTPTASIYDGTGDPDDGTTVDIEAIDFTVVSDIVLTPGVGLLSFVSQVLSVIQAMANDARIVIRRS